MLSIEQRCVYGGTLDTHSHEVEHANCDASRPLCSLGQSVCSKSDCKQYCGILDRISQEPVLESHLSGGPTAHTHLPKRRVSMQNQNNRRHRH